jgi:hypothetical protein
MAHAAQGSKSGHFAIESTLDLANWTEQATVMSATGDFFYTDPASFANRRYYRARYYP